MNYLEKVAIKIRHLPFLRKLDFFWDLTRPIYNNLLRILYKDGLTRVINGTDVMFISPEFRNISEIYEPETWKRLMAEICEGDIIADVGAFIGLYTIALAKRVGPQGKVIAFEPDKHNRSVLKKHIDLNRISSRIEIWDVAIGSKSGLVVFSSLSNSMSHIVASSGLNSKEANIEVRSESLDNIFHNNKIDIIKVDVEGQEEEVLLGAKDLLERRKNYPRAIFIEVHPYAWEAFGTTSEKLLSLLINANYRIEDSNGNEVRSIERYGEIIALKD